MGMASAFSNLPGQSWQILPQRRSLLRTLIPSLSYVPGGPLVGFPTFLYPTVCPRTASASPSARALFACCSFAYILVTLLISCFLTFGLCLTVFTSEIILQYPQQCTQLFSQSPSSALQLGLRALRLDPQLQNQVQGQLRLLEQFQP